MVQPRESSTFHLEKAPPALCFDATVWSSLVSCQHIIHLKMISKIMGFCSRTSLQGHLSIQQYCHNFCITHCHNLMSIIWWYITCYRNSRKKCTRISPGKIYVFYICCTICFEFVLDCMRTQKSLLARAHMCLIVNDVFVPWQYLMPCEPENMGLLHPQLHHRMWSTTQAFIFC